MGIFPERMESMKFSDSFWLNKPGYEVNYATQMYEITADDKSVKVLATNQWIGNRGMTHLVE